MLMKGVCGRDKFGYIMKNNVNNYYIVSSGERVQSENILIMLNTNCIQSFDLVPEFEGDNGFILRKMHHHVQYFSLHF